MRVRWFMAVLATVLLVVGCTGSPPPEPIIAVAAGGDHSCALRGDGTVSCWGENFTGALGDGTTTDSRVPVAVIGIANATAIAASNFQTCALLADGGVSCWGFNGEGQLGNGTTTDSSVPVLVTGITDATAVAIGNSHSCALLADGGVSCWGRNDYGLLGDGTTIDSSVPIPVTGITDATAIASHGYHSCALLADGGVSCWGINQWGQLGNGTASWFSNVPVEVSGLSNATGLAVGYAHACAIVDGGGAVCWGQGGYGQLGDGVRPSYALVPVAVAGMTDATALIAGDRHTCAILGNGDMSCWGPTGSGSWATVQTTNRSRPSPSQGSPESRTWRRAPATRASLSTTKPCPVGGTTILASWVTAPPCHRTFLSRFQDSPKLTEDRFVDRSCVSRETINTGLACTPEWHCPGRRFGFTWNLSLNATRPAAFSGWDAPALSEDAVTSGAIG
ncbi:MAG: hypothetical protein IPF42_11045 [Candidatus Microthrix sp.]|nr:hypothetical protein [Candidatus Microthrix sp.]